MPDDHSHVRQVRVSRETVRTAAISAVIVLSILGALGVGFFVKEAHRLRAERLAQENELLTREVHDIRAKLASMEGWMDRLARMDRQYRLVAGLTPIDKDVQLAGVGGPGTETLQSNELWRTNPELGEMTFSTAYDLNALIRRAQLLASSWEQATDSLTRTQDRWLRTPSIQPVDGYISSSFSHSRWHPILNRPRPHEGIDITALPGAPIIAAAAGRVVYAGWRGQYGRMIEIDHGYGVVTRYAHASKVLVERGDAVERGEKIAEVGQTGLAKGPHLHYEVLVDGRPVDPRRYILNGNAIPE